MSFLDEVETGERLDEIDQVTIHSVYLLHDLDEFF